MDELIAMEVEVRRKAGNIRIVDVCLINVFYPECYESIREDQQVELEEELPFQRAVTFGVPVIPRLPFTFVLWHYETDFSSRRGNGREWDDLCFFKDVQPFQPSVSIFLYTHLSSHVRVRGVKMT